MKPCQFLNYESEFVDCELRTCEPEYPDVKYWHRHNVPYQGAAVKVQFCKLRGRVPGIFQCWQTGEMPCYEPKDEANESNV